VHLKLWEKIKEILGNFFLYYLIVQKPSSKALKFGEAKAYYADLKKKE